MINAILKGIFSLINSLFSALVSPIVNTITSLFPALNNLFTAVTTFLNYGLTYVRSILNLILFDDDLIQLLFTYFITLYTIYTTVLAVKFAIKVYNKLKI